VIQQFKHENTGCPRS